MKTNMKRLIAGIALAAVLAAGGVGAAEYKSSGSTTADLQPPLPIAAPTPTTTADLQPPMPNFYHV